MICRERIGGKDDGVMVVSILERGICSVQVSHRSGDESEGSKEVRRIPGTAGVDVLLC